MSKDFNLYSVKWYYVLGSAHYKKVIAIVVYNTL